MSRKGLVGSIIGSIVCSVLIMSGLLYFIGPTLLPGLTDQDILLQYQYEEWNSQAYIFDTDLTYQKMEDTEINITISQNSRLFAQFSAIALLSLSPTFTVRSSYNISLVVAGVTNRTYMVLYFDTEPSGGFYRELTYNMHINLLTEPLPVGTYNIAIYWKSTLDATGTNSLSVAHNPPVFNYTRTMLIQELKSL